jgi:uncharacterized protein
MEEKRPTYANGKICYLEIPAQNIEQSAAFYGKVFGWKIRSHEDGSRAFDDGVGEVSGMWVLGNKPMTEPGIIVSIMVDDADVTSKLIGAHGGVIVHSFKTDGGETIVHFTDPAGNFMGLYQSGSGNA